MVKLLLTQDNHNAPGWIEESKADNALICRTAKEQKADAICIAGDWWHRSVIASDSNKYGEFLQMAEDLQNSAPHGVFYVHGTPSHDAPGAYEALKRIGWKEVGIGKSYTVGNVLIMGIPEITPAFIMAQNPELSKQDAIARQYELIEHVIENYYVPVAMAHDGPVHFMGHGHVQGVKFRDDQKPRTSDFMYSEALLKKIEASYYQFGHIHLPQSFHEITGGYGGSSHITWGDIGFEAGFNVIGLETRSGYWSDNRFSFGKPERQKITISDFSDLPNWPKSEVQAKYAGTDLWIDIKCDKEFADQFDAEESLKEIQDKIALGPLSKITCNIQHIEHTRVDTEEYEACKSTEDIYRIYDQTVSESILLKVREAEENTADQSDSAVQHAFEFLDLKLRGSKAGLENGVEEIFMDWNDFSMGSNLLTGPNGTGKSFTLGFCQPFSQHLPTGIDYKKLFDLKDSEILRRFKRDSDIITQKIVIDPTLSSPTAKYYMDINGVACDGVTGNKQPFDDAVTEIFGSIRMFMACAFRGQKENPKIPSLENASETDLRQIFMNLANIDRSALKDYAHSQAVQLKRNIELTERERDTLSGLVVDDKIIRSDIYHNKSNKAISENDFKILNDGVSTLKLSLTAIEKDKQSNESINAQISSQRKSFNALSRETGDHELEIDRLSKEIANISEYRTELSGLNKAREEHAEISEKYFKMQEEHNSAVSGYQTVKDKADKTLAEIQERGEELKRLISKHGNDIQSKTTFIKNAESLIERINKPCEHCGKLAASVDKEIAQHTASIHDAKKEIDILSVSIRELEDALKTEQSNYRTVRDRIPQPPTAPPELASLKSDYETKKPNTFRIQQLEKILTESETAQQRISELRVMLSQKTGRMDSIDADIDAMTEKLIPVSEDKLRSLQQDVIETEQKISQLTQSIADLTAKIGTLNDKLKENEERQARIKELTDSVATVQNDVTEWQAVEAAFGPKGIPAMELSMICPIIDREANKRLSLYNNRFSVEIVTQGLNSRNEIAEKFSILVHDSFSSEVKTLDQMSGGQSAWIVSALNEAITTVAAQRSGRIFLWSILDEADSALDDGIMPYFYKCLEMSSENKKVISVSHSPAAREAVQDVKNITDFFVGYRKE